MDQLSFALIGCGNIAGRHAEQIIKHGKLAAVCDIIETKANIFADKYNTTAYTSLDELLQKETGVNIVIICTPNYLHAPQSIQSLQTGKHVLCEKPMAIAAADAEAMIIAAEKANKKLYVVKQNRYNPPVVLLKKLLDENKLGAIHSFQLNCFWNRPAAYFNNNWKGKLKEDGGTLYTQFSHFIDILCWFLGPLKTASGCRYNYQHKNIIEFEDAGVATLQLDNNIIGTINYNINTHQRNMEGSLTLFGEKGTVKIGGQYLNVLEHFEVEGETMPVLEKSNHSNQYGYYEGSMSNHDKVYIEMIKALNDDAYNFMNPGETLMTIEAIEKIYAASPLLS